MQQIPEQEAVKLHRGLMPMSFMNYGWFPRGGAEEAFTLCYVVEVFLERF